MNRHLVIALIVTACSKAKPPGAGSGVVGSQGGTPIAAMVPHVDTAAAYAASPPATPVPMLVVLAADGKRFVAHGPATYGELASFAVGGKTPIDDKHLQAVLREASINGPKVTAAQTWKVFDAPPEPTRAAVDDDPPPPPEEDHADDNESGGTGTAMALDEGKMGKKDSTREAGQYTMKRRAEDGDGRPRGSRDVEPTKDADVPVRLATVLGSGTADHALVPYQPALILADPKAAATELVALETATGGTLLVTGADHTVHPLDLQFSALRANLFDDDRPVHWIEVRVLPAGLEVEGVPGKPVTVGKAGELAAAIQQLRATPRLARSDVDVLVDPTVDTQHLVDVLAALDAANIATVALGALPPATDPQRRSRGQVIREVEVIGVSVTGDLDKAKVRALVKAQAIGKLHACYETELAKTPDVAGVATTTFTIDAHGKPFNVAASGLLSKCASDAIGAIAFPDIRGGGIVQVNLVVRFAPER